MERKTFTYGSDLYKVKAEVRLVGSDMLIIPSGGNKPHIGSIAAALPPPALKTASVQAQPHQSIIFWGTRMML